MYKKSYLISIVLLICLQITNAQQPQKLNSDEIYNQIEKLNFLGSVLYIAAHPDDENTRLISFLANDQKARTAYLSLTRGDGGQNLIGTQLRELLGVIRTQELIEARKIDGGEQFFSRANDFGFSKNPSETLSIWEKEKVLADVIWAIRKFQPDVIVNRFDHRSPGTTHGHHTASAMLSVESFKMANDPTVFPEQLQFVKPWQTKRQFFNTSWWFYGTMEKFNAADKTNLISLQTGTYYSNLGKSNQEIAALSRSRHQSQGFGSTGARGEETEYLEFINGEALTDKKSLFEGVDTSWNRVKGGAPIGELLAIIAKEFDHKNPSASIPNLAKAYTMMQVLEPNQWSPVKAAAIKEIIAACAGLYLEAVSQNQEATPGSTVKLKLEAINRSTIPIELISVKTIPNNTISSQNQDLKYNQLKTINLDFKLPETLNYTQPYWLQEAGTTGMYTVNEQNKRGLPDILRETKIEFTMLINGIEIPYERTIVYKYNDDVKGEIYNYLDVVPDVTTAITDKVLLFKDTKTKQVSVKIKAGKDNIKGNLQLELPKNWIVMPQNIPFSFEKKGMEQIFYFDVTAPKKAEETIAKSVAIIDNKRFDKEQIIISYDHITKQQVLQTASAKCIKTDLKTNEERIAYIMGAGDEVPNSLTQLGYKVTLIKADEITPEKLEKFDVVMTGVRAYNTINALVNKQAILFDFVKNGKTMIVQYNTAGDLVTNEIAPYPLKLSRDRVTEEDAEIRFLAPNHPVMNYPNTITEQDFKGWKQEQGLYYPNEFDKAFTPIFSSNDKGETPKNGALLIAPYGKGHYVYTGISFFRELPEGVAGAYKLISNIISLKPSQTISIQNNKL
ncbi:PIG-L family deacetylase [Flavobacterium sp. I-STPA6A]|uniref:PIG-L family deacetylase n=1 Tax=Flavobacterium sp. I-STPA6A TaxID=2590450 RepID=UPI00131BD199|nr:PIG-L family deacetylase [Flavobacterium sp. I-STPA6A]